MIVDAHHHLWDPDRGDYGWMPSSGVLAQPHLLVELAEMRDATGAACGVVVQAAPTLAESEFLMALARSDDRIAGVIGWVDLDQPVDRVDADLDRLAALGPLVGVRPMIEDIDDVSWLGGPRVQRGLARLAERNLTFDLLCREHQLPGAVDALIPHEHLTVAVDHLAKPDYPNVSSTWFAAMEKLARLPHSFCKISGMVTEVGDQPTAATFRAHVAAALDLFGPSRCMFGSDWPVCRAVAEADRVRAIAEDLINQLAPDDAAHFWADAAGNCYRLGSTEKR